MSLVFLGCLYPSGRDVFITQSKVMPQYAASKVCEMFVSGLEYNVGHSIDLLNVVPIADFPLRHKMACVPGFSWSRGEFAGNNNIGFCNLYGVRQFSRRGSLSIELKSWINARGKNRHYVIAYGLTQHNLYSMHKAKIMDPMIHTCLIVPDLPQFMAMDQSFIYRTLKRVDVKMQKKMLEYVDSFVLFSRYMTESLEVGKRPSVVIEGLIDRDTLLPVSCRDANQKNILYSGAIEEAYGIKELLAAFSLIKGDAFRLQIIGDGSSASLVREWAARDPRIQYLGVKANAEVQYLQKQASVLVNPRQGTADFTRYSFPSKTLEYLASGTPTLVFKLQGIPDEYDNYLCYFKSADIYTMAEQMEEVCSFTAEVTKCRAAKVQHFLQDKKDYRLQTKKILDMMNYSGD